MLLSGVFVRVSPRLAEDPADRACGHPLTLNASTLCRYGAGDLANAVQVRGIALIFSVGHGWFSGGRTPCVLQDHGRRLAA